ncbi:MAG: hypothetical protein ACK5PR_00955, partial [bacterium]
MTQFVKFVEDLSFLGLTSRDFLRACLWNDTVHLSAAPVAKAFKIIRHGRRNHTRIVIPRFHAKIIIKTMLMEFILD